MSQDIIVLVASTAAGLASVTLLVAPPAGRGVRRESGCPAAAAACWPGRAPASLVLAFTGWIVPALVVAVAAGLAARAWQQRDRRRVDDVERTEALASWIENLRDVLIAGDQPIGAIAATVSTCPRRSGPRFAGSRPDSGDRRQMSSSAASRTTSMIRSGIWSPPGC